MACSRWLPGLLLLVLLPGMALARAPLTGALAEYVAAKDDSYRWVKRSEGSVLTCKYIELTLTSQTWRGIVWKHQLFVVKPGRVNPEAKHATLFIAGGSWRDELADPKTQIKLPGEALALAAVAEGLQTPVAILLHVPQQPLFGGKREDEIISLTFREYLKTGEADWPLLEPMVKSAVRAMDATQESLKQEWGLEVERFTITGASKRGWTTWLTAAADDRVVAIAPMVINMLNMSPHSKLQKASFGGQASEQIDEYKGLDDYMDTPRGVALRKIVDPWEYRSRLELPKLVILGTNDRYWPLDASNLYWNDLVGEKYLLWVPNAGHDLKERARVVAGLAALNRRIISGQPLPKIDWKYASGSGGVRLSVTSDVKPSRVRIWTAKARARDFRESLWTAIDAAAAEGGYAYQLAAPSAGYAALLGELVYNEGTETEFSLSTDVRMVPAATAAAGGQ
ncbi:MAG TPA: PhoPQ-activated protein PqaA family protein [Pirellulaceae bacterium]|nr:PhoPQ-activated protein PqaA family protein [Pirellulaceae bacterium]